MKVMMFTLMLLMSGLSMAQTSRTTAQQHTQHLVVATHGPFHYDLQASDLCFTHDGQDFQRRFGGNCFEGDVVYIDSGFDDELTISIYDTYSTTTIYHPTMARFLG